MGGAMGEFDLIARYFTRPPVPGSAVAVGVGDDCAVLQPAPGMQLAVSSDMLVQGRHFFADVDPRSLGHKALAVNLSDLAACGAEPLGFTLALALPEANPAWLEPFAHGLLALADAHGCQLVGGDTTAGPLNICITVFGQVPRGQALLRSGAQVGDDIWVSGTLGDACLALQALQGQVTLPPELLERARQRLEWPTPRVALGQALRGVASAALDVSDGLLGDLGHVLRASGVGAEIDVAATSDLIAARACLQRLEGLFGSKFGTAFASAQELAQRCILAGGDDYELVFTAAPTRRATVQQCSQACGVPVTRIGHIQADPGLRLRQAKGMPVSMRYASFDHFA